MLFQDRLTLDQSRRTNDGYLAVSAKFARPGVQVYAGREVDPDNAHGLRDQMVNVLRPADEVFSRATMDSFRFKPITDDHPSVEVNASNWKDLGSGLATDIMRDGDWSRMHALMMDGALADKVEGGKRQLSAGYSANIEFGDFIAPDGTKCQAKQTNIRGNHIAVVDSARAGPEASIVMDAFAPCAALPSSFLDSLTTQEKPVPKILLIDGLSVDISNVDVADATIKTLIGARDAATSKVSGLETQVATLTTDKATLENEVKALKDSKPTPAQLRDAAKQFAIVTDKAKALGVTVTDAMGEAEIMKAAVLKHVGDAAKDWSDAQISASFATLPSQPTRTTDVLRDAITNAPVVVTDSRTFYADSRARQKAELSGAWRTPAKSEAA